MNAMPNEFLEPPKKFNQNRKINKKSSIMEFVKSDEYYHPENIERDKYASPLILPFPIKIIVMFFPLI